VDWNTPGSLNLAYYTATTARSLYCPLCQPQRRNDLRPAVVEYRGGLEVQRLHPTRAATLTLATMASRRRGGRVVRAFGSVHWNGNAAISQYSLWIGTDARQSESGPTTTSPTGASYTATLPAATGAPVYVRLWSLIGGAWMYNDYTLHELTGRGLLADSRE